MHLDCAQKWLNTGATTCPTCRAEFDEDERLLLDVRRRALRDARVEMHALLHDFQGAALTFEIGDVPMLLDIAAAARELITHRAVELIAHPADAEFSFVTAGSWRWTLPTGVSPYAELWALLARAELWLGVSPPNPPTVGQLPPRPPA